MEKNTKQKINERFKSLTLMKKVIILIILIVLFIGSIIFNSYLSHRRKERIAEQQSQSYTQETTQLSEGKEDGTIENIEEYFKNEIEIPANNVEGMTK